MTADTLQLGQTADDSATPQDGDMRLWSVTTIIGVLDSPGLKFWAAEQAAIAATRQQATWKGMLDDCPDDCQHLSARECEAVKWLRNAMNRRPKDILSASDLGTVVHTLCEEYALTGQRPDTDRIEHEIRTTGAPTVKPDLELPTITAMLDQFDGWLSRAQPSYQATEVCVYSPTYGYAGTCDAFMTVDGTRFITDYKTTREPRDGRGNPKTPYPEVSLQLAAYRYAEGAAVWRPRRTEIRWRRYYLMSEAERKLAVPVPEVDAGLCIHITPEACEAYPVACDEGVHTSFLYVQEAARWNLQESKDAVGEPLQFDREAVAS